MLGPVMYDPSRSEEATLSLLKSLMVWFKADYPYYYDGCMKCANAEGNVFLGVIAPTPAEQEHYAGRTELYQCGCCASFSRFARYNHVGTTLYDTNRGRCGEYSVVALALVEALGYTARWIVDWADHLWIEVLVQGRWVHLDPCEAAVDEPLLYESWGKNQTYIMAFTRDSIEDVTSTYTTQHEASMKRRDTSQDDINRAISEALVVLRNRTSSLQLANGSRW